MLLVLLLLVHHRAVLPAGIAIVLRGDAVAVFRDVAVGGQKISPAALALAGCVAMVQSVHQVIGVEIGQARKNHPFYKHHFHKKQGKEAQQEIAVLRKKIDTMQKRQAELTKLFKRLYEDSVLGRIPDEQYRILSQEYTTEQKEIQEQLPAMEVRLQELKDSSTNIARFIENAKRYKEIPKLTAEILRIFIKRVEVGERAEKYSRTAPQEVRIYYRDIGLVDELPQSMADSMAEEIPNEVA